MDAAICTGRTNLAGSLSSPERCTWFSTPNSRLFAASAISARRCKTERCSPVKACGQLESASRIPPIPSLPRTGASLADDRALAAEGKRDTVGTGHNSRRIGKGTKDGVKRLRAIIENLAQLGKNSADF